MNNFIKTVQTLTRKGDAFLARQGLKNFHQEAASLLASAKLHQSFDFQEVVTASFDRKKAPAPYFSHLEFSDLPLTVARGENCFIDLYFWRRRPTVIHNHHFMGAFQCLKGNNVDLEFKFHVEEKLSKFISLCKIEELKSRVLKSGDIAEINYLDKFIHQNHHQADLTINLCFRTPQKKNANISNYLFSGLRYEKDGKTLERVDRLIKLTQIEDFVFKQLDLTVDDAVHFLIQTAFHNSQNNRFIKLRDFLHKKVMKETGMSVDKLVRAHEKRLDDIIDLYH